MKIKLVDKQQYIDFSFNEKISDVQVLLNLKKVVPSVMEFILPILNDGTDLEEMEWESQSHHIEIVKKLHQSWAILQLRLKALEHYKNALFVKQLIQQGLSYRQKLSKTSYTALELDYLFFLYLHSMIDSELIQIGESFYCPTYKQFWQKEMAQLKEPD